MKLTIFQLEAQLNKQQLPIYLLHGDEWLIKHDNANLIRKAANKAGFLEHIRVTPENGYDWEDFYTLLYSNSLFASKRLIDLDFRDNTPNKEAIATLSDYAKSPINDIVLLIQTAKLDDKATKSSWYKALETIGAVLPIWPMSREQMPQWLIQRAKKYKLQLNPAAAQLLTDYVEGNLSAAAQIIEKAFLLKPEHEITTDLLQQILTDESRFSVFDLVDAMVSAQASRALHILQTLQADGIDPVLVLWGLTREFRIMAELAQSSKQGIPLETTLQKHRIFPKRQAAVRRFVTRHTAEECQHYLLAAAKIDANLKGAEAGDPWQSLQLLCLRAN